MSDGSAYGSLDVAIEKLKDVDVLVFSCKAKVKLWEGKRDVAEVHRLKWVKRMGFIAVERDTMNQQVIALQKVVDGESKEN